MGVLLDLLKGDGCHVASVCQELVDAMGRHDDEHTVLSLVSFGLQVKKVTLLHLHSATARPVPPRGGAARGGRTGGLRAKGSVSTTCSCSSRATG